MIERIKTRAKKSEQCAGFFRVSYKRKTPRPFFTSRLHQPNPSSAEESTRVSHKRNTPQAFFNFRLHQPNPSSAELATSTECEVPRAEIASVLIKEKRAKRFSTLDFINQIRAVRNLQRARSAKFPAQDFFASPIKEKRLGRFSTLDFINQIRAVVVRGTSLYPSLPYFCSAKIRDRSAK